PSMTSFRAPHEVSRLLGCHPTRLRGERHRPSRLHRTDHLDEQVVHLFRDRHRPLGANQGELALSGQHPLDLAQLSLVRGKVGVGLQLRSHDTPSSLERSVTTFRLFRKFPADKTGPADQVPLPLRPANPAALSTNHSSDSTSSAAVRLTVSGSPPWKTRLIGTSMILPVRVRGIDGAAMTSSGTERGETCSRMAATIPSVSSASNSAPSSGTTKRGM